MLPFPIRSFKDFQNRVRLGLTPESISLEFKAEIDLSQKEKRRPLAEDLAIDLASFANSLGGSIIIGVTEQKDKNNLNVAGVIKPVSNAEKVKVFLNTSVRNLISPTIDFESTFLGQPEPIIVVNISPSIQIVGVCLNKDRDAYCYPYRTELGNRFFPFTEVEARMNSANSRAMYLKLLTYLQNRDRGEILIYPKPLVRNAVTFEIQVLKENPNEFELIINSRVIRLPYSLIDEIWNKSNAGQNLCVKLKERVIEIGKDGPLDLDHPLDREFNSKAHQDAYSPRWTQESLRNLSKVIEQVPRRRR